MSRMGEFEQIAPKRETLKNAALSDEEKEYLYLYRTVNNRKTYRNSGRNEIAISVYKYQTPEGT